MSRTAALICAAGRITAAEADALREAWRRLHARRRFVRPNPALERVTDGRA